jgi:hypothetical protein
MKLSACVTLRRGACAHRSWRASVSRDGEAQVTGVHAILTNRASVSCSRAALSHKLDQNPCRAGSSRERRQRNRAGAAEAFACLGDTAVVEPIRACRKRHRDAHVSSTRFARGQLSGRPWSRVRPMARTRLWRVGDTYRCPETTAGGKRQSLSSLPIGGNKP